MELEDLLKGEPSFNDAEEGECSSSFVAPEMLLENVQVKLEPSEDKSDIVPIDADAADADAERRSESAEELSEKSSSAEYEILRTKMTNAQIRETKHYLLQCIYEVPAVWQVKKSNSLQMKEKFKPEHWFGISDRMTARFGKDFSIFICQEMWRIMMIGLRLQRRKLKQMEKRGQTLIRPTWEFWGPLRFMNKFMDETEGCDTPFVLSEYIYMAQFVKHMSSQDNMMDAIKRELPVSETLEYPSPKRPKTDSSVQQMVDSIIREEGVRGNTKQKMILKSSMKEAKYHLIELVKEEFAYWNLTKMDNKQKFKPQKWNHIRESMEDKFGVEITVPQCMDIWRILFVSLRQYRKQYPFEQEPGWIFWKPLEFLRRHLDEVEGVVCPQMRVQLDDSEASTSNPSPFSQPKPLSLEKIKKEIEETEDSDEIKEVDMLDASSLLPSVSDVSVNEEITMDQELRVQFTKRLRRRPAEPKKKVRPSAAKFYLIGLVRESPIIWNDNILDAAAMKLKYAPAAWESISLKMSTFFQCSITLDDCKQMWGDLMQTFTRYRKELKLPDSQGDKLDLPKNWPFWMPMKFLKDYYENMEKQAESQIIMVREQARFCSICLQKFPEKDMQSMRDMGHAIQVEQTLRCAPRLSEKFKIYNTIWVCRKHMRDYYNIVRMQKQKKDVHKKIDDRCIKSVVNALKIVQNSMGASDGVVEYETSEPSCSNMLNTEYLLAQTMKCAKEQKVKEVEDDDEVVELKPEAEIVEKVENASSLTPKVKGSNYVFCFFCKNSVQQKDAIHVKEPMLGKRVESELQLPNGTMNFLLKRNQYPHICIRHLDQTGPTLNCLLKSQSSDKDVEVVAVKNGRAKRVEMPLLVEEGTNVHRGIPVPKIAQCDHCKFRTFTKSCFVTTDPAEAEILEKYLDVDPGTLKVAILVREIAIVCKSHVKMMPPEMIPPEIKAAMNVNTH